MATQVNADLPLGMLDVYLSFNNEKFSALQTFNDKFAANSKTFGTIPLMQHLILFKAIYKFASSIDPSFESRSLKEDEAHSPTLYAVLTKAIVRFKAWVDAYLKSRSSRNPLSLIEIPPLDVLIILHGYIISPWALEEDAEFLFPELRTIPHFPLEHMQALISIETGDFTPSKEQVSHWEKSTKLPFDVSRMPDTTSIECPFCRGVFSVPWISGGQPEANGVGFGERGFHQDCTHCHRGVTHALFGISRLLEDLHASQKSHNRYISASLIGEELYRSIIGTGGTNLAEGMSIEAFEARIKQDPKTKLKIDHIDRLLLPYSHWWPYSADLIGKAKSAFTFAKITHRMCMLDRKILTGEDTSFFKTITDSYRYFLKSILYLPQAIACPRHRTDIAWHTHQLYPAEYKKQTRELIGTFMNHVSFEGEDFIPSQNQVLMSSFWRNTLESHGILVNESIIFAALLPPGGVYVDQGKKKGPGGGHGDGGDGGPPKPACGHGLICVNSDGAKDLYLSEKAHETPGNTSYQDSKPNFLSFKKLTELFLR